jgi:hypothetical protein
MQIAIVAFMGAPVRRDGVLSKMAAFANKFACEFFREPEDLLSDSRISDHSEFSTRSISYLTYRTSQSARAIVL